LIHALEESIEPAHAAFAANWPAAQIFDLLDTSLAPDLAAANELTPAIGQRLESLARYAVDASGVGGKTQGIVFTCSAFGAAIDAVKARFDLPVLRPNECAFEEALNQGERIGLVVSFGPSAAALETELHQMARARDQHVVVRTVVAEGALAALKAGDTQAHDRTVADTAATLRDSDVIILGQFSMARAAAAVALQRDMPPILTTPRSAVEGLKRRLSLR
jgi:Asp/Glu/hydantoin racemase